MARLATVGLFKRACPGQAEGRFTCIHAKLTLSTRAGRQLTCHMLLHVAPACAASGVQALNPYAQMQGDNPYAVSMALVRASCKQAPYTKHPASEVPALCWHLG